MNLFEYNGNLTELMQDINIRKNNIDVPDFVPNDLIDTYKISRILDEYVIEYFAQINGYNKTSNLEHSIDKILQKFKQEVLQQLLLEKEDFRRSIKTKKTGFKNIFEFSGSENLYLSNIYTNFISENLGHKFEDIANLSSKVVIPERVFNLKLKGIDLIINDNSLIRYTQLKTKKDTLTGSQSQRSINELRIHNNSIFAAALDMGQSWHLNKKDAEQYNIVRLAGSDFWSLIDIDYNVILRKLSKVIKEIDQELYK
jgi:hypothetical protein